MVNNSNRIQSLFQYIRQKPIDILIYLLILAAVIKIYSLYSSSDMDNETWQRYKNEHNCHERISTEESKISSWQCDNGEVFFNWRQQR